MFVLRLIYANIDFSHWSEFPALFIGLQENKLLEAFKFIYRYNDCSEARSGVNDDFGYRKWCICTLDP